MSENAADWSAVVANAKAIAAFLSATLIETSSLARTLTVNGQELDLRPPWQQALHKWNGV